MMFQAGNGGNLGMTHADDVDAGTNLRICASSDSCILCEPDAARRQAIGSANREPACSAVWSCDRELDNVGLRETTCSRGAAGKRLVEMPQPRMPEGK